MTSDPTAPGGDTLGGHYRIERELGHGGMATVYLCTDTRSGETAAVKVLRPELASVVTKERFFREIAFSAELDHPRIPRVIESGTIGELPFYAMNFVDGESLRDRMKRDPHFTVEEVVHIATKIIEPMSFAHKHGIVHRDIKPENVLLHGNDVYVLDFGVARAIIGSTGERLTRTGITVGTPAYMSPEQVTADRDLDPRSDIYSLGCVVYEMLAGTPPFRGNNPHILMAARFTTPPRPLRNYRPDIPESIERAVATAMQKNPGDRWQSADDFAAALALPTATGSHDVSPGEPEMIDKLRATFAETYKVEEEMKGGGMARLFLATDLALNRKVVIKILPPELVSQMMLARFRRESEVTARLQHPHILPVISAGVRDGLVHYIMPFIDGESLRAMLEREGQFTIPQALRILREVTDALAYAHKQGIIHRDIKPENILIQDGHAVLADFGIAAALSGDGQEGEGRLTGTGMSLGTVGYMAPEQALGEKTVDARADIYAVGVVGYEIFAGTAPFKGNTDQAILVAHLTKEAPHLDDIRADTPLPVAEAIRKAMQKDPALRFQDAGEFRDAIDIAVGTPTRPTLAFPAMRRLRRLSAKAKAAVGVVAVALVATIGYLVSKGGSSVAPGEMVTIAIAPFNTLSSGLDLWREGMVDVLARNLDGAGPLRTVSPTLSIRGFTGTADKTSATQLAKRTKAQYAIYGTLVGSENDSVTLRGGLVNVSSNETVEYNLTDSTAESVAGKFTLAVLGDLGKTHRIGASDVRLSSLGSPSIPAVRAFLQGEQFFRRTSWDSAATSYARAISFDSLFAIALRRAAQVAGWQVNGSDSAARAMWLRAGAQNRGLSPRDSLLLASDSLSAALAALRSDSMDWPKLTRLFTTVNDAASRYPDDPEIWYAVGEARFHLGYGSPANITERQSLEAFDRAIELDSAFAPAYVHAVELAFNLDGAEAGKKYTRAYLKLNPTDDEAEGIAIVDRVASATGSQPADTDAQLDRVSSAAIMAAYFTLRRWPDPAQTALRLLQSLGRRPRDSPTFQSDSLRMWNFLPLELAYRGRMAEAHRVMGNRPSRLFVEMALIGGIPADSASAVVNGWVERGMPQAFFALQWFARQKDSTRLGILMGRADSAARTGTEFSRRSARYRAASTRAYLSLVRNDSTDALARFTALQDTLCIACYVDRLEAARLLAARGRLDDADRLLGQRLNSLITPIEILIAFERGRVAGRLGKREEAVEAYRRVADAWAPGDPALQPYVAEARREFTRLGGGSQAR